jgi:transcription elongation GreA/GreB family factor
MKMNDGVHTLFMPVRDDIQHAAIGLLHAPRGQEWTTTDGYRAPPIWNQAAAAAEVPMSAGHERRAHGVPAHHVEGRSDWPIDARAMRDLLARIERLERTAREGDEVRRHQRLDALRRHGSAVSVVFDPEVAAIGRRVTIGGEDTSTEAFWLSLPGDEHATANTLSIAAPTGRSLAGARVGDVVSVDRGSRRYWAVVLDVA